MKFGDAPFSLNADIASAKIVELVVRQKTGTRVPASAAWADARLLK